MILAYPPRGRARLRTMSAASLGISVLSLIEGVLGQSEADSLPTALQIALLAFALSIPLSALGFIISSEEWFGRPLVVEKPAHLSLLGLITSIGMLFTFFGLLALFYHLFWLAALVFFLASMFVLHIQSRLLERMSPKD